MPWWRNRGVTLKVGCPATEIDVGRREINIANDESVSFSMLGLATRSAPLRLNMPGADLRIPPIFLSSRHHLRCRHRFYEYTAFFYKNRAAEEPRIVTNFRNFDLNLLLVLDGALRDRPIRPT
jgi:hypothetical protein